MHSWEREYKLRVAQAGSTREVGTVSIIGLVPEDRPYISVTIAEGDKVLGWMDGRGMHGLMKSLCRALGYEAVKKSHD